MIEQYKFHNPLDYKGNDVLHGSLEFIGKKLLHFSLSVTCNIENENHEIIRFDSSHNFVHVHELYKKPKPEKPRKLEQTISWDTVQEITRNIKENYLTWKKAFTRNHLGGV